MIDGFEPAGDRIRELNWVVAYATVIGIFSILIDLGLLTDGELVAFSRAAIAILGIVGGVTLWRTPGGQTGWLILLAWAVVQIPMIAWDPVGSPTEQFFAYPLGYTETTTVNGIVTEYSQFAVNIVGVILLVALIAWRNPIRRGWRSRPATAARQ